MNTTLSPVTVQRCIALQGELIGLVERDYAGLSPKLEQVIRAFEFTQIELVVYRERGYGQGLGEQVNPRQIVAPWQLPPSITVSWLQDTGEWEVLGRVASESDALARMHAAITDPKYDLFGNNCEHFARFVTTGKFESTQLRKAVMIVGWLHSSMPVKAAQPNNQRLSVALGCGFT